MISNMKATGRSAEETQAALSQFILNCPVTDPDAEEVEVNVDEFEHTEVEQRARRDQQRMLAALARHRRDPEVQREGNDVTQARHFSRLTPRMATTPPADPPYPPLTRYRSGRHRAALSAVATMSEV